MIGQQIGNYRLVKLLGAGGMGMVYEAVHDGIGGRAAIKVLRPEIASHKDATQRFFSEARAANLVAHPAIVHIFDCGYTAAGTAYLTMEYLEGETLKQRLDRLRILTVSEAIRIVRQVASGLHAAHQRSVIHRDLKPDNLMLVPDSELPGGERVKILDFGVAKISEGLGDQTRTGMVMGTPAYMAPEQCREAKLATDRSDVYSLGVILYQTLAGQPPFVGEYAGDVMAMQMMKEPPPLSQFCPLLQRPVVEFVHRLLEKKPALRPGMEEVIRELQRLYDLIVGSQTQGLRLDQLAASPVLVQSAVRPAIRQQTEALTAEELRRFAQSTNQPVDSSRNPVVRSGPEPVAERPTAPLSIQTSDGKSVTVPWSIIASVEEIEPVQQSLPPLHVAPASPPSALPASVKSEETPSAMRSATPPSTTLSPNARQVEKGFVLQSRIATQLFFLNSQGATAGGLSGSLLLGYKMGRILLGIGCEYNNLTVSVPTANVATSSSNFLVIPTLQIVLIRSPDQRVELVGSFRLGLGRPVGAGASSSFISSVSSTTIVVTPLSLKYEIAPGVRFWAHPHLAVSALAGLSGEYYLFLSRISDRSSRGENSMAASLEVMGVF